MENLVSLSSLDKFDVILRYDSCNYILIGSINENFSYAFKIEYDEHGFDLKNYSQVNKLFGDIEDVFLGLDTHIDLIENENFNICDIIDIEDTTFKCSVLQISEYDIELFKEMILREKRRRNDRKRSVLNSVAKVKNSVYKTIFKTNDETKSLHFHKERFANYEYTNKNISSSSFFECNFENAIFNKCILERNSFINCKFKNCKFVDCTILDNSFTDCKEKYAIYENCKLENNISKKSE